MVIRTTTIRHRDPIGKNLGLIARFGDSARPMGPKGITVTSLPGRTSTIDHIFILEDEKLPQKPFIGRRGLKDLPAKLTLREATIERDGLEKLITEHQGKILFILDRDQPNGIGGVAFTRMIREVEEELAIEDRSIIIGNTGRPLTMSQIKEWKTAGADMIFSKPNSVSIIRAVKTKNLAQLAKDKDNLLT